MLIFDIGYNTVNGAELLKKYLKEPFEGFSFKELKNFLKDIPDEFKHHYTVTVWQPDYRKDVNGTVQYLETFDAGYFDKRFNNINQLKHKLFHKNKKKV